MSTLYLVPTPLGHPDDITLRALRILREAYAIAVPGASSVQPLLDQHSITTQTIPYGAALAALEAGDVALIAAAGTPGIGDEAHEVVVQAIGRGIRVESLPGASAEITALVLSGLPTNAFVYVGALPDDLSAYARERDTMIFSTQAPHAALQRMQASFGSRRAAAASNLTLPSQIIYRGMLTDAVAYFAEAPDGPMLIVVEGAPPEVQETWDEAHVRAVLRERLAAGEPLKLAAKAIAEVAGWDRRAVYALGVDEKRNTP